MSRIGRMPIAVPAGVTAEIDGNKIKITGPKGTLTREIDPCITMKLENGEIVLTRSSEEKDVKAKHGLYRALIANMVKGVNEGYTKSLTVNGVGYKLTKTGNKIVMNLGLSHSVTVEEVPGITLEVNGNNEILVKGADNELVGQVAAKIRDIRKVEPYHAYGIRYTDEVVIRKVSKTGKK